MSPVESCSLSPCRRFHYPPVVFPCVPIFTSSFVRRLEKRRGDIRDVLPTRTVPLCGTVDATSVFSTPGVSRGRSTSVSSKVPPPEFLLLPGFSCRCIPCFLFCVCLHSSRRSEGPLVPLILLPTPYRVRPGELMAGSGTSVVSTDFLSLHLTDLEGTTRTRLSSYRRTDGLPEGTFVTT